MEDQRKDRSDSEARRCWVQVDSDDSDAKMLLIFVRDGWSSRVSDLETGPKG